MITSSTGNTFAFDFAFAALNERTIRDIASGI